MSFLQPEMKSTENLGYTPKTVKVPFMRLFLVLRKPRKNQYVVAEKDYMILHIVPYELLTP